MISHHDHLALLTDPAVLLNQLTTRAIFCLDPQGQIVSWYGGAEALYGYRAAEIIGRSFACLYLPEAAAQGLPATQLATAAALGHVEESGWRCRQDGSTYWSSGLMTALHTVQGELCGYAIIGRNASTQQAAVQQVEANALLLTSILDSAMDAIISVDEAQQITLFNVAAEQMFRCPASDALGQLLDKFIPDRFRALHTQHVYAFGLTGVTSRKMGPLGLLGLRADGTEFPIEASISQASVAGRKRFTVILRDITQRQQAEIALQERLELQGRLEKLAAAAPVVLCTFRRRPDGSYSFPYASPAIEAIYSLAPSVIAHDALPALAQIHPDDREAVIVALGHSAQTMTLWRAEFRVNHPQKGQLWIEGALQPEYEADGSILWHGFIHDISERKQLEDQLRQSQKMEAIGQLAGGVAHDFNNLLTVIIGYSDLFLAKSQDVHSRKLISNVRHAGERATGLTQQLLAFSRKQILEPKVVDLNEIVTTVGKILQRLISENIALTMILSPAIARVKVDPHQIEQVVINLAVNARDAMPDGGQLTIQTQNVVLDEAYCHLHPECKPGQYVQLSMSDTGQGMTAAVQARIFEPFFTTKGPGKGTGLGLSTVFGIIKQSEGHIQVYSEVGIGTSFKIYLPTVDAAAQSALTLPTNETIPVGDEVILLVEDDPHVRQLGRIALETHGYTVAEADNGRSGLAILLADPVRFALLVTDVVMPELGGRQLVELARLQRPDLKVLFMSGYIDDAVTRHNLLMADEAFLHKPFSPSSLARKVREVLDS